MTYPLVRDLACDGVPVGLSCRVLGFSRQAYYAWLADPVSQRDYDDAHLLNAIIGIHADDPEFGYRFITDELHHAGHRVSENRVARLCALQGVSSVIGRRRRRGGKGRPGPAVHDDLVGRDFTADRPDEIWLTDISEHPTGDGKLYICAVKDVCSRRIVGYAIGPRKTARLADTALRIAIARRQPAGTVVVHSDRGGQFRSRRYQTTLRTNGLAGSMGRVGAAGDNAAMESFFSLLQHNVLDRGPWDTREELIWPSLPGSNAPTTAADANAPLASSPRSNSKPSSATLNWPPPHDLPQPPSTKVWSAPSGYEARCCRQGEIPVDRAK